MFINTKNITHIRKNAETISIQSRASSWNKQTMSSSSTWRKRTRQTPGPHPSPCRYLSPRISFISSWTVCRWSHFVHTLRCTWLLSNMSLRGLSTVQGVSSGLFLLCPQPQAVAWNTGRSLRYSGFSPRPPHYSKDGNRASHTDILVSLCLSKFCLCCTIVY